LAACTRALRYRVLSAEEVEALPFVDESVLERIQQPIDMPLRWKAQDAEHSQVMGSYEEETQVHVTTSILSYSYEELDSALCDEKTCSVDGEEIKLEEPKCRPLLRLKVENRLQTDDNALQATLIGEVGIWGSQEDESNAPDELHSHGYVDLRDVLGTLRFELDEPRQARLLLQITYDAQGIHGYVAPQVILSDVGAGTFDTPLIGGWGWYYDR
jgi:hypothetical protein